MNVLVKRRRRPDPRSLAADDGLVALEFALIAPAFLLLVFGTMVFALYFATFVAVIHGASEGARASVAGLSNTERGQLAAARVVDIFSGYAPLLNPARTTVTSKANGTAMYEVTVTYPVSDFGFDWFYALQDSVGGTTGSTAPVSIGYSVTVANGGY